MSVILEHDIFTYIMNDKLKYDPEFKINSKQISNIQLFIDSFYDNFMNFENNKKPQFKFSDRFYIVCCYSSRKNKNYYAGITKELEFIDTDAPSDNEDDKYILEIIDHLVKLNKQNYFDDILNNINFTLSNKDNPPSYEESILNKSNEKNNLNKCNKKETTCVII